MTDRSKDIRTKTELLAEIERLQFRLEEAEETLEAIRTADVDALVVAGPEGEQVFSISGAEHIYRVIVETMNEAALTVDPDGTILFCNQRFCDLMKTPIQAAMGRKVTAFAARPQQVPLKTFLAEAQAGAVQRRLTLRAATGMIVPVQLAASPLEVNGSTSICLVATDLTELEASAKSIRILREHQQALEESETRFRTMFEASQDAIVITNDEGVYVQANPAVQAVFGLPPEQLLGRSVSEYLNINLNFPTFWRSFLATGSFRGELSLIDAHGQQHDVDSYAVTNIVPGRHMAVLHDITERKQAQRALEDMNERLQEQTEELEEQSEELRVQTEELAAANAALRASERRLRIFFESDMVGTIYWNMDGQILEANNKFLQMVGYTREDLAAARLNWVRMTPPEYQPQEEHALAELKTTGVDTPYEKEYVRKDGARIPIIIGSAMLDETRYEGVAFVLDITARKRMEEQLRELNTTLESKVAQRTAELQHRARQLQKLTLELSETEDRERRQLAEILHDDLQQQLAAAKFHLSLLSNRAKHDPAQQAVIAQVDEILMEAIQKSRNLSHELSPAVLYHGDFGGALSWLAGQIHAKHGLEVTVDAFGEVNIASEALKSFLYKAAQEMLFNVVKHARIDRARIRVRRFGRCICLSVSDRGRGFDPQDVRQAKGFGLLSIRERVELLGGRMKMHSVKGKGSTFHVLVPDGPLVEDGYTSLDTLGRAHDGAVLPGTVAAAPRVRVLLADDHEIVREGLISLLSDVRDIEVVGEAANGREAINQAYRLQPDVIVMDVAMPLINGDDATRQIKLHLPQTRVIALSMYEEPDMVEKMRHAGAEAYLLKTAPSEQLVAAIRGQKAPPVTA